MCELLGGSCFGRNLHAYHETSLADQFTKNKVSLSSGAKFGRGVDVVTSALLYLRVEPWHDPT